MFYSSGSSQGKIGFLASLKWAFGLQVSCGVRLYLQVQPSMGTTAYQGFSQAGTCCPLSTSLWASESFSHSLSQKLIIWFDDFLLRALGHCSEVRAVPQPQCREAHSIYRRGKISSKEGESQCSGKGAHTALEVRHTPGKVCAEGGAGAGARPWTLSVGQCAWGWCGSVFVSGCVHIHAYECMLSYTLCSLCVGEHVYGLCRDEMSMRSWICFQDAPI